MQEGNVKNIWSISRVADTLAPVTAFLEYHLNKFLWSHTNRNTNVKEELLALAHGFRRRSPWSLNSMSLTSWLLPYHGSAGLWWRDFSMEDCQQTTWGSTGRCPVRWRPKDRPRVIYFLHMGPTFFHHFPTPTHYESVKGLTYWVSQDPHDLCVSKYPSRQT